MSGSLVVVQSFVNRLSGLGPEADSIPQADAEKSWIILVEHLMGYFPEELIKTDNTIK